MMQEIKKVESERQAYLRKQNLIGRPTNQRLEDYRINIRGVTFRWQRGIKIGKMINIYEVFLYSLIL